MHIGLPQFISNSFNSNAPRIPPSQYWILGGLGGWIKKQWSESAPKTPLKWGLGGPNSSKSASRWQKESQEGKQGSQDCHEETQREPSCSQELQSESKMYPKSIPKSLKNQNKTFPKLRRFVEGHLNKNLQLLDCFCKPRPAKTILKTMVFRLFRFWTLLA